MKNQHGKQGETASKSKTSKYEIEESIIESTSRINNIQKESVNLHTPPTPDNTTCTDNLHTPPKPNNTEDIKKTKKHNPLGNLSTGYENNIEIDLLKSKLDRFAENVLAKLDDLAFEINHIKENKPYSIVILEDVVNDLKKEKLELRKMNDDHQERIIDMSRTISDLKLINKNLEEKKSSLLTTIRRIQSDHSQSSTKLKEREVEQEKPATWKVSKPSTRSKVSFSQTGENIHETSNQYAILSGSETNAQQLQMPIKLHGSEQNQRTRQQHTVMDISPQNTTAYKENHEMHAVTDAKQQYATTDANATIWF